MTRSTASAAQRTLVAGFATALVSLALLALAACGAPSTTTLAQTSLPDAATILQKAEAQTYKDVTFNMTIVVTVSGKTINATGTGEYTKTPLRTETSVTTPVTVNGKSYQKVVEQITDKTTNALFTKTTSTPAGLAGATGKWVKTTLSKATGTNAPIDVATLIDFSNFQGAKMIGADTIDGVSVWHLQSTDTTSSTTSSTPATGASANATATAKAAATATSAATADLYVRQDTGFPAKETVQVPSGATPTDLTLSFTKFNSDLTIALP